ncbi:hypothetical protein AKJ09_01311 [Labilithrix luteola]|uniref:Uncharacterized protein n=1 Tax=Labilithrix luteola TaxID=1391654 RepID=A0A0K1PM92_9BACT|nr:hypothetical protein AKJ09_01311 [Labilithrix luteola]
MLSKIRWCSCLVLLGRCDDPTNEPSCNRRASVLGRTILSWNRPSFPGSFHPHV